MYIPKNAYQETPLFPFLVICSFHFPPEAVNLPQAWSPHPIFFPILEHVHVTQHDPEIIISVIPALIDPSTSVLILISAFKNLLPTIIKAIKTAYPGRSPCVVENTWSKSLVSVV